jgi:hypothetical protein
MILQIAGGEILTRDQERGLIRNQHHWREIGGEIVERIFVKRLVDGIGPAAEHELIAVRSRLRDARRAHHSAGAADILDDHLLAQNLGQPPPDDAPEHVGAAASRERDHHGQRAAGPALRDGGAGAVVAKPAHDQGGQHGISRTHVSANPDSGCEMSLLPPAIGAAQ